MYIDVVGTLSAVQTASFMLLWLHAIAVILAAPSCTSWMFLMYLPYIADVRKEVTDRCVLGVNERY